MRGRGYGAGTGTDEDFNTQKIQLLPGRGDAKRCILMEFVHGEVLEEMWSAASEECKSKIILQLKGFLKELRSVRGNTIGTVIGSPCRDRFFEDQDEPYGPFATQSQFREALVKAMLSVRDHAWVYLVAGFVRSLPESDIVFTHSDLAPRNIIVRGNQVVAILDWELAGLYPAYWDYVKAYYLPSWDSPWILDMQESLSPASLWRHSRSMVV